ncbi:MAG: response regulator transcription factor [Deltaproteobacteria bacterium]|nr:response regulator transcription factor [Deltaproteobacteria bacterium]
MIRVLLADDHAVVRRGLRQILEDERDISIVGEAATGREALEAAVRKGWDVLLLDLSMPDMTGLEVLGQLRRRRPRLPVLVLTMHSEEQFAVLALRAGAAGYLTKDSAPEEMVGAIRAVAAGRRYVSRALAETVAGSLAGDDRRPPHETLSPREFRVLCLMARGKTTDEIAKALLISPKTVATYRARMMDKMALHSIAELTRYALDHKLLD